MLDWRCHCDDDESIFQQISIPSRKHENGFSIEGIPREGILDDATMTSLADAQQWTKRQRIFNALEAVCRCSSLKGTCLMQYLHCHKAGSRPLDEGAKRGHGHSVRICVTTNKICDADVDALRYSRLFVRGRDSRGKSSPPHES
jgi:hypothetical protein